MHMIFNIYENININDFCIDLKIAFNFVYLLASSYGCVCAKCVLSQIADLHCRMHE